MGYRLFKIFVDNPTGSYCAGSNVTGRVVLVVEKPKKIRGLQIKFEGSAKVSWSENRIIRRHDGTISKEEITFSNKEKYFSDKYFLIGSAYGEVEIPPGENVYLFSTTLPPYLPSSFDEDHGNVQYTVEATLFRPWKMNAKTNLYIPVVTPLDLNFLPQVKEPVFKEATKTFCWLCCKSGPLTLAVSIPYSGYVPGQTILTAIEVDNASDVHIDFVNCKLIKKFKWITLCKTRISTSFLEEFNLGEVPPNDCRSWSHNVEIPHMRVFNLHACSIIKVEFYLEVLASPSGAHTSLVNRLPITLGTVPLGTVPSYQVGVPGPSPTDPALPSTQFPLLSPAGGHPAGLVPFPSESISSKLFFS